MWTEYNLYMEDLNNTTDKFALNVTPMKREANTFSMPIGLYKID